MSMCLIDQDIDIEDIEVYRSIIFCFIMDRVEKGMGSYQATLTEQSKLALPNKRETLLSNCL